MVALNAVLSEEATVKMPIFCMYSQYQQRGFQEYTQSKGVDHFISKPPNQDEICKIITKALEEKQRGTLAPTGSTIT